MSKATQKKKKAAKTALQEFLVRYRLESGIKEQVIVKAKDMAEAIRKAEAVRRGAFVYSVTAL